MFQYVGCCGGRKGRFPRAGRRISASSLRAQRSNPGCSRYAGLLRYARNDEWRGETGVQINGTMLEIAGAVCPFRPHEVCEVRAGAGTPWSLRTLGTFASRPAKPSPGRQLLDCVKFRQLPADFKRRDTVKFVNFRVGCGSRDTMKFVNFRRAVGRIGPRVRRGPSAVRTGRSLCDRRRRGRTFARRLTPLPAVS